MTRPRPRLLMVEDAGSVLSVMRDALWRAGFDVESASTATEAVELLASRRYAAIVATASCRILRPSTGWRRSAGPHPTHP